MKDKLVLILLFGCIVTVVYVLSMFSVPHRGWTKCLEQLAVGTALCLMCYVLFSPFGIRIPQTPFSAACAGFLGFPGVALAAFLSVLP